MTTIQHKRGISSNWTSSDPVLAVSEIGYETDTGKFKIGDGASAWSALPYFSTGSGSSGTVTSITAGTGLSGGTITTSGTIALSHLGIESLTDPNADRILFWDDSASSTQWLTLGTNLSISGTTINATDTNTTYTAGTGLTLSGTEFSVTANTYQPLDADLTAIAALSANGLLRKTAGTWGMDTATYLTSYTETDTLSDVTGRGATTNTAISITNATSSTNTTTGALKVTGGVGIQENLNVGGNVIVTGDLTVNGTTTTINSTIVTVDDPIFTLGGDTAPGSDDNKDRGIAFRWHNGVSAKIGFFGFDDSTGYFTFVPDATITSEVISGSTGTFDGNITGNAASATTATSATSADTAKTVSTATNASFYPVFVDANNGTATAEALYTDAGLIYNPSTNQLSTGGDISVNGGDLLTSQTTFNLINTTATTLNIGGAATTMAIGSSTSTVTFGNIVSADEVYATNNGNGTNFKVGDDTWLGDINISNTLSIRGQQNAANAYIVFGNGDSKALGRAGTGRLTYDSALVPATYYKIVATDNTSLINTSGGVAATYSAFGTNGINLPVGSYEIDMVLLVTATASSNSSTLIVTPGSPSSAAVPSSTQLYYTYSDSTTAITNAAATSGVLRTGTTTFPSLNTITIATGTTRYLRALVKGIVNIATAGNFTIRLAFAPGAGGSVTGTIYAGSYLKLTPLGAEAVTDIGTWA